MTKQLQNRLKSLAWRVGMMCVAFAVQQISNNLSSLELDPSTTIFLGLVLGEISKFLNTQKK